ncbi:hypothetical protein M422DRAFT_48762 [Sphaerobolus stellatus SS14]|uniref:Uncharacterized protein n=1 Tax=Sphaerobolus stellatus (strain SS14) TaxID=990650 RepID=A0A0C9VIH5_SPHS4|nr:hypothetical protein M422DRAFT_48762 [Sphaerobolus stellatus SS14]
MCLLTLKRGAKLQPPRLAGDEGLIQEWVWELADEETRSKKSKLFQRKQQKDRFDFAKLEAKLANSRNEKEAQAIKFELNRRKSPDIDEIPTEALEHLHEDPHGGNGREPDRPSGLGQQDDSYRPGKSDSGASHELEPRPKSQQTDAFGLHRERKAGQDDNGFLR